MVMTTMRRSVGKSTLRPCPQQSFTSWCKLWLTELWASSGVSASSIVAVVCELQIFLFEGNPSRIEQNPQFWLTPSANEEILSNIQRMRSYIHRWSNRKLGAQLWATQYYLCRGMNAERCVDKISAICKLRQTRKKLELFTFQLYKCRKEKCGCRR